MTEKVSGTKIQHSKMPKDYANTILDAVHYLMYSLYICRVLKKKELYNGISKLTVWRVLRKRLNLKAYKLSIVQYLERCIVSTSLSMKFP
jgi:hypothetical protein